MEKIHHNIGYAKNLDINYIMTENMNQLEK